MQDLTLRTEETLFLIVDVQERLVPAMHPDLWDRMRANLLRIGEAARLLGVPVIVTEQYPKGLGPTLGAVKHGLTEPTVLEKNTFDAEKDERIRAAIAGSGRKKVVVAGMEAHICVYQTARSLAASQYNVHVLHDAIASRTRENYEVGVALMRSAGAAITSTETVLFDLLGRAGTEEFKAISKLVR